MSESSEGQQEHLQRVFENRLNRHGYSFQYAVINKAKEAFEQGASAWGFMVAEFPVQSPEKDTRIDFILKHTRNPIHMVAECKRANPALSNWCFVKAPFVQRGD